MGTWDVLRWLLVVVFLGSVPAFAGDAEQAAEHRQRAAVYQEDGRPEEAAVELRAALQVEPGNIEDRRTLGNLYLQLKDGASAFREFQEVVSRAPDDGEARLQLATFLLLNERYGEAGEQAGKATELLPQRFEGFALMGRARSGLGDREGALEAFRRAVDLAPENEILRVELARQHAAGDQPEKAAAVLRQGIRAVPPSVTLRVALASLLAGQKEYSNADRLMGEVENLATGNLAAIKAVALYRLRRGDASAAESLLRKAVTDAGENPQARLPVLAELANFYSLVGNLPRARDTLREVQALAPDHALTLARLANLYLLEGDEEEAVPLVEKLIARAPDDRNARLLKARLDIVQGELDRGTAALEGIVGEAPDSVNANLYLGKAYAMARDWEKARSVYLNVLEQVPSHFFALLDLSKVNLELGRPEAALERAGQVLDARPENVVARRVRVLAWLQTGKAGKAEGELQTLLADRPDEPGLHLLMGHSLAALGRLEGALGAYRRSRELAPAAAEPLLREVGVLARLGRDGEVTPTAEEFLERNGEVPAVINALASYHMGQGRAGEARKLVARSLAADGDAPETRELEARLALAAGDPPAAEAALQKALAAAPQRTPSLLLLAGVYEGQRRNDDAAELYRRVLAFEPGHPVAANNLAVIYSADPDRQMEALQLAQQAVERAPDSPFTRDTLGWVQYRMGSWDAAARNIERARTSMPEHPEIAYHLGAVYAKLGGRTDQAVQLLKEALEAEEKGDWALDARQLLEELEAGKP